MTYVTCTKHQLVSVYTTVSDPNGNHVRSDLGLDFAFLYLGVYRVWFYIILFQTYSTGGDGEVKCHDCIDESCYMGHSMLKQHTKKYLTLIWAKLGSYKVPLETFTSQFQHYFCMASELELDRKSIYCRISTYHP